MRWLFCPAHSEIQPFLDKIYAASKDQQPKRVECLMRWLSRPAHSEIQPGKAKKGKVLPRINKKIFRKRYDRAMEQLSKYEIRWAKEEDRLGIAETLVDGFYKHFKSVAKSKDTLHKALLPALKPERFVVAVDLDEQKIVGTVSISDKDGYPIIVLKPHLRKVFGFLKGTIVAAVLRDEYYIPKVFADGQAQVDNVAVRESARKQGLAKAMLSFALKTEGIKCFTLDVVEGNEAVLPLYESVGFKETGRKKENFAWQKGFSFRYILTHQKP